MKNPTLTLSPWQPSTDVANLAQLDHEDLYRLTEDGPVLRPGPIMLTEKAFANITPEHVWTAVALHECGVWGACGRRQAIENEEALTVGGVAESRWFVGEDFEFTIETSLEPGDEQTTLAVSPGSPLCKPRLSPVRLGDVLLDDSVYCVPYMHIWFALRAHETGCPGDTGLFTAPDVPNLHTTAVSWWADPGDENLASRPFWVLTHLGTPPLTFVFAGGDGL